MFKVMQQYGTAAQPATVSVASASYALGPDESGRLSFFIKKST